MRRRELLDQCDARLPASPFLGVWTTGGGAMVAPPPVANGTAVSAPETGRAGGLEVWSRQASQVMGASPMPRPNTPAPCVMRATATESITAGNRCIASAPCVVRTTAAGVIVVVDGSITRDFIRSSCVIDAAVAAVAAVAVIVGGDATGIATAKGAGSPAWVRLGGGRVGGYRRRRGRSGPAAHARFELLLRPARDVSTGGTYGQACVEYFSDV